MEWYLIVLITYVVMCIITLVIAQFNEEHALYWAIGFPALLIWLLSYPVRTIRTWERCKTYYQKKGIKKWQYILGKRIK